MKDLVLRRAARLTGMATLVCLSLMGCGGGSIESASIPAAATAPAAAAGGAGSITGATASIVGDYTVAVSKFDCSGGIDILPHLGLRPPLARKGGRFLRCYS